VILVLDTNVISELMRPKPTPSVVEWLDGQPRSALFVTSVSIFEISTGLARLGDGLRKQALTLAFQRLRDTTLADQVLDVDAPAAVAAAALHTGRLRVGRLVNAADTFIAGIAISRGASIATRNIKDFADCGIPLVDPWSPSP
jgi:hypothetical protein